MDIGQVLTFSTQKDTFQCEVNSKKDLQKRRKRKLQQNESKKHKKGTEQNKRKMKTKY